MSLRDSGQVTFLDVVARFSEEEWKLLQEWQKELYNTVMKEIQQALVYLGPLIATSVFSLKPKERECQLSSDGVETTKGSPVVFRKAGANHHHINETEHHEDVGTADVVSFIIKEEGDAHSIDHLDFDRAEQINSTTGFPFHNVKAEVPARNYVDLEREESPTSLKSLMRGHEDTTPVSLITVIEDEEPNPIEISNYRRKEFNNNPAGQRAITRKWKDGDFATYAEKSIALKAPCGKVKAKMIRKSQKESNSKSQMWSVSNQKIVGEKGTPHERGFPNTVHPSSVHQGTPKSAISDQHNTFEHPVWSTQPATGQATFTAHQRTRTEPCLRERYFQCTECNKRFSQKVHLVRHQRTHSGERPYCCTQCGKSFIQKHHLLGHQRAHSGEKPFQCTQCMKSFSWKECLYRHQRTHTAKHNLPTI